jgi:hypothetical protein
MGTIGHTRGRYQGARQRRHPALSNRRRRDLNWLATWASSPAQLKLILVENPARLYGFRPDRSCSRFLPEWLHLGCVGVAGRGSATGPGAWCRTLSQLLRRLIIILTGTEEWLRFAICNLCFSEGVALTATIGWVRFAFLSRNVRFFLILCWPIPFRIRRSVYDFFQDQVLGWRPDCYFLYPLTLLGI